MNLRIVANQYHGRAIYVRQLVNLRGFAGKAGKVDPFYPSHIHQKPFSKSSLIDTRKYKY